jgi:hypothetical protein
MDNKGIWDYILLWGPWIFALALVCVGVYQVWLMMRQTGLMKRQADLISRQTDTMDQQRAESVSSSNVAAKTATDTLKAITEQAGSMKLQVTEMQAATRHAETQSQALAAQVKIMEAPYQQWIEVNNWFCKAIETDRIMVYFEVVNPTHHPLLIPSGNINFTLGDVTTRSFTDEGMLFQPNRIWRQSVPLRLTEEQSRQFLQGEVLIRVEGNLDFVDVLHRQQPHPVQGRLWCKVDGARFESDAIWIVRPIDPHQGEQKAN